LKFRLDPSKESIFNSNMAKKTLIFFPDPILRKRAKRVDLFDARKLRQIRQDLEDSLKSQRHGIGIAAPQIGLSIKIVLIDVSSRVKGTKPLFLINPLIKDAREEGLSREGCMSLPDYTAPLKRYHWIDVAWQDEDGVFRQKACTGIEAICVQHEIDHLEGILFLDRVASLKKDMIPRPRKKSK